MIAPKKKCPKAGKTVKTKRYGTLKCKYVKYKVGKKVKHKLVWMKVPTPAVQGPPVQPPADSVAPGLVGNLRVSTVTASTVALAWINPGDADLAQVIVRRALGTSPPGSAASGFSVTLSSATATSATDVGLASDTEYSYAVFTKDATGNVGAAGVSVNARTGAAIVPVPSGGATLAQNQSLEADTWLASPDGRYKFWNRSDGNLVVTVALSGRVIWTSGTAGLGPARLVMQPDGNLVLFSVPGGAILWQTQTSGSSPQFGVRDDAKIAVYSGATRLWGTTTIDDRLVSEERLYSGQEIRSPNGRYWVAQAAGGNLVGYDGAVSHWNSGIVGQVGNWTIMQADGNLVIYVDGVGPAWATNTVGNGGAWAAVLDTGKFVIYSSGGTVLWTHNL